MRPEDDLQAPNTLANLNINSGPLRKARAPEIEQSATRVQDLAHVRRVKQREQWLADNTEAMSSYNACVESHGVFSDGLRRF